MLTTGTITTEGADIVFDRVGRGPAVLAIAGAGGDGATFRRLAAALADTYTVVSFDRRGNGRSSGDRSVKIDMVQQARDARAVLRAATGGDDAWVFGHSGGANIGLVLAAHHPEVVRGLVAHEPPALAMLGDASEAAARNDHLFAIYRAEGAEAAYRAFTADWRGIDTERLLAARARRAAGGADLDFFFAKELRGISSVRIDFATIRAHGVPVIVLVGDQSGDAYYARAARAVAAGLGCPLREVPGHHLSFLFQPAAFAQAIRDALATWTPASAGRTCPP